MVFGLSKRDLGDVIAATGAVVLFVSLFLPWYRTDVVEDVALGDRGQGFTAWLSYDVVDLLLLGVVVVTLATILVERSRRASESPRATGRLLTILGTVGIGIFVYCLFNEPETGIAKAGYSISFSLDIGIFLAFSSALCIATGGVLISRSTEATQPLPD